MGQTLGEFLGSLPDPTNCKGATDYTALGKRIRAELKLAVERGVFPPGTAFSVRKDDYKSFTVDITEWVGAVFTDHYTAWRMDQEIDTAKNAHGYLQNRYEAPARCDDLADGSDGYGYRRSRYDDRCTDTLNLAIRAMERICDRHNYNRSRIEEDYFDVGYYLHVGAGTVISAAEQGIAMEANPAMQDLQRRAADAAKALGPAVVKSYCGKRGLAGAHSSTLESLVKLAEKANGRPLTYDKSRRAWLISKKVWRDGVVVTVNGHGDVVDENTGDEIASARTAERMMVARPASEHHFRSFMGGKPTDVPYRMIDGRAHQVLGRWYNETENAILGAITAGRRGGRVKGVNWSVL